MSIVLRQRGTDSILKRGCGHIIKNPPTHSSHLEVINSDKVWEERKNIFDLEEVAFVEEVHCPGGNIYRTGVVVLININHTHFPISSSFLMTCFAIFSQRRFCVSLLRRGVFDI